MELVSLLYSKPHGPLLHYRWDGLGVEGGFASKDKGTAIIDLTHDSFTKYI